MYLPKSNGSAYQNADVKLENKIGENGVGAMLWLGRKNGDWGGTGKWYDGTHV